MYICTHTQSHTGQHIRNQEHVYHVLETPQDQLEVSFMSPDIIPIRQSASFSEATTPIYQDISEVSSSKTYIQKSESNVDQDSRGWRSQTIPLYQVIPAAESELDENVVTSCDENDRTVYQQITSSGTNVL